MRTTPAMFESTLSSTRLSLEQLFGRSSSRLQRYRSSSWLATAEDTNRGNRSGDDIIHNVTHHLAKNTARNLRAQIPARSWDSHMHVLDPRFQLSPSAVYTPSPTAPTTLKHAQHFESDVGLDNIVLVQPSIYGYDNSCLLDALRVLGPNRARGVVAFEDPALWAANDEASSISPSSLSSSRSSSPTSRTSSTTTLTDSTTRMNHQTLREWHELGVRGVRINLQSSGEKKHNPEEFRALLQRYIDIVRPLGWVVQMYVGMDMVHILEPLVNSSESDGVKLCIDHMGHPHLSRLVEYQATHNPYTIPGFAALVRLLDSGKVYVKLSAAYRFSTEMTTMTTHDRTTVALDTASRDVWPIAKELLRVAGKKRVVFATDWPHTRFDGLDIRPWMQSVVDMCAGDEELVDRVFRGNAEDLWSVEK